MDSRRDSSGAKINAVPSETGRQSPPLLVAVEVYLIAEGLVIFDFIYHDLFLDNGSEN